MSSFDVIVVGAGHAGAEAAAAAARLGVRVGLCTLSRDTVGHMPCNPAIGGTAKGHLVREIDALGGLMGRAIDATGIQFKLLNRSRGPAVWSPRAQADKHLYSQWVAGELGAHRGIEWLIGRAGSLLIDGGEIAGVEFEDGRRFHSSSVVITTGTFLNGLVHVGPESRPSGRAGESPSVDLAHSLRRLGFTWGRLKTGTPPRVRRSSIDFASATASGMFPGAGLMELVSQLTARLSGGETLRDAPRITNVRHTRLLAQSREALVRARAALEASDGRLPEEFLLIDLQDAHARLQEVTGQRTPEDILRHIFATFCIGK